jgi:hypothetical protein
MSQNVTLSAISASVVRDDLAPANGIDLPRYWDAPKVGTMTEVSSAESGKQCLRRGPTPECKTRKAKIEAKLEGSRMMADKDLRQQRPDVGQKTKPIPAMRIHRWTAGGTPQSWD